MDEAREGGVRSLTAADLRRAGLGADVEVREVPRAVYGHHVVAHHLRQLVRGLLLDHPVHDLGGALVGRQTAAGLLNQIGLRSLASAGDGAHVGHELTGVDEVGVLPDAGPGQVGLGGLAQVHVARGSADAVKFNGIRHADALGVALQRVRLQLLGDLSEGAVAGVGQGLLEAEIAVGAVAGDDLAAGLVAAVAVEGLGLDVRDLLNGRRRGDQLEDGAGDIGGVEEAVDVDAIVGAVALVDLGDVVRVIGRRGHGAEDFAGLVVVDAYGPLLPVQGRQGRRLHLCAQGEGHSPLSLSGPVGAGEEVVADQIVGVFLHQPRGDVAGAVAQDVHGGHAQQLTVGVIAAVGGVQQDGAGAVGDHAGVQIAAGVHMRTA